MLARLTTHRRARAATQGAIAVAIAGVLAHGQARADDTADLCLADSLEGQVLRQHGRLLRAREHLAACAAPACEPAMQDRCRAWNREVSEAIPSYAVVVRDDRGAELPSATVHVDDVETPMGAAVECDPGMVNVRAAYAGRNARGTFRVERKGQRLELSIDLRAEVMERPTPKIVYVLGSLAGVGAIGFGLFGGSVLVQSSHLSDCKPYCRADDRGPLDTAIVGSTLSVAVGLAALAAASVLYLSRPTVSRPIRVGAGTALGSWAF